MNTLRELAIWQDMFGKDKQEDTNTRISSDGQGKLCACNTKLETTSRRAVESLYCGKLQSHIERFWRENSRTLKLPNLMQLESKSFKINKLGIFKLSMYPAY
jgi:hypothetical protein